MKKIVVALLFGFVLGAPLLSSAQDGSAQGGPHSVRAPVAVPKHAPRAPAPSTTRPHRH